MLETLATLDRQLFYFINVTCANPVTDVIMPQITSDWNLRIAYGLIIILLFWKGNRERRWLVVGSIVTLVISDLTSSALIKPLVGRPRPCHTLNDIHLLVNCGTGLSMPSSHAANAFAQWMFWSSTVPKFRWHLFVVAFLIAISRAFVGVHYPGDILIGGLVGALVGGVVYAVEHRLLNRALR
jgi:undecaprenyl-diphosphatase